jgi:hypothetical protein
VPSYKARFRAAPKRIARLRNWRAARDGVPTAALTPSNALALNGPHLFRLQRPLHHPTGLAKAPSAVEPGAVEPSLDRAVLICVRCAGTHRQDLFESVFGWRTFPHTSPR